MTSGGTTTVYIGNYFEWTGSTATMKSYYYAGGTRVAMRTGTPVAGTVNYLLGNHLGSTSLTLDSVGNRLNTNMELRYYPYGVPRYTAGTTPTTFNFTGQRKDSGSGLLFYAARWYDPVVGRFLQADTIVPSPGEPQSLNRYSYVGNRPTVYRDPTGHMACGDTDNCAGGGGIGRQKGTPSPPVRTPGPASIPTAPPQAVAPVGTPPPAQMAANQSGASGTWSWGALFTPDTVVVLYTGVEAASDYAGGYVNAVEGYAIYKVLGKNGKEYWVAAGSAAALQKIGLNPGVANSTATMNAARAAGRGGDGVVYVVGWGVSVAPNLIAHAVHGDLFSKNTITDLIIDTGGWGFSEGVGVAAAALGAATGFPPLAIAGEVAGSLGGSVYWDNQIAPGARAWVRMQLR